MVDTFTKEKRSSIMSKVRGKNTKPELLVRSLLHRMGFRFRLHRKDLPGKPDIVLPRYKKIILVHGCFWHQHPGCKKATIPATNKEFWKEKLGRNIERDKQTKANLQNEGWRVLVVWECQIKNQEKLKSRLQRFLAED